MEALTDLELATLCGGASWRGLGESVKTGALMMGTAGAGIGAATGLAGGLPGVLVGTAAGAAIGAAVGGVASAIEYGVVEMVKNW